MAKEVKTSLQKEYQKERRRLLRAVKRGEQEGFIFPEDVVPSLPKRVSKKRLQEIRSIKPKHLYEKAQWLDKETGELVDAKSALEVKRKRKRKAEEQDISSTSKVQINSYYPTISAIEKVRERIRELGSFSSLETLGNNLADLKREVPPPFPIEHRKNALLAIFDDTITLHEQQGTLDQYENYIVERMCEIEGHLNVIRFDSKEERIEASFASVARILNQGSLSVSQAESLSHMAEYYEEYEEY